MDHGVYIFFSDVFLNWGAHGKICEHYHKKMILPLMISCKTLYKVYGKIGKEYDCGICYFRDIKCCNCKMNGVTQCDFCTCRKCGISINFTGHIFLKDWKCHSCFIPGQTGGYGATGCPCCENKYRPNKGGPTAIGTNLYAIVSEKQWEKILKKDRNQLNKDRRIQYQKNMKRLR
jgi:hypothetical protein